MGGYRILKHIIYNVPTQIYEKKNVYIYRDGSTKNIDIRVSGGYRLLNDIRPGKKIFLFLIEIFSKFGEEGGQFFFYFFIFATKKTKKLADFL